MNIGDLIYTIITLILMVLVITSPILRKIFKSAEKSLEGDDLSPEDRIYESVDSHRVVNRMMEETDQVPHLEFTEPRSVQKSSYKPQSVETSPLKKIEKLPSLKQAVIWKEILDRPVSLR